MGRVAAWHHLGVTLVFGTARLPSWDGSGFWHDLHFFRAWPLLAWLMYERLLHFIIFLLITGILHFLCWIRPHTGRGSASHQSRAASAFRIANFLVLWSQSWLLSSLGPWLALFSLVFSERPVCYTKSPVTFAILKLQACFSYQQIAFFVLNPARYRSWVCEAPFESCVRFKIANFWVHKPQLWHVK